MWSGEVMVPFLMMGFLANVVQFLLSGPAAMARWTRMALVRLAGVIQVLPDCLTQCHLRH